MHTASILTRYLITFCFTVSCLSVLAQPGGKPAQENQQQQAINAIKKQIADLEREIAADKAAQTDPRKIRSKEERLNGMKSVLAMMGSAGPPTGKQPVAGSVQKNGYTIASPILPVRITRSVTPPTPAQARDRMMGFYGKRIDDSTLITTQATLVRFSSPRNLLIIEPDKKKDTFPSLVRELQRTGQRQKEMIGRMKAISNHTFYYPEIFNAYREFAWLAESYAPLLSNTINLPPAPSFGSAGNRSVAGGHGSGLPAEWPVMDSTPDQRATEYIRREHQRLKQLLNNPPPLDDFPAPPRKDFDLCWDCDTIVQKKYYEQLASWHEKTTEYERNLIRTVFSIEHTLQIYLDGTPEPALEADLRRAQQLAFTRFRQKVERVYEIFKDDVAYHTAILQMTLGVERQVQLLGVPSQESMLPAKCQSLFRIFEKYFRDEMQNRNYTVVLNFSLVLGYERQQQLLGAGNTENENSLMDAVFKFNRFELTLDMDFDVRFLRSDGEITLQATGHLQQDGSRGAGSGGKVFVRLGMKNCKWQLFLAEGGYFDQSGAKLFIPLKIISGNRMTKTTQGTKNDPYSGPDAANMGFPATRLNFCTDDTQDSCLLELINYDTEALATYSKNVGSAYTVDFIAYANRILLSLPKVEQNKEKIIDIGKMIPANQPSTDPTGDEELDEMQRQYKGKLQTLEYQKQLRQLGGQEGVILLFDAYNQLPVIIDVKTQISNQDKKSESVNGNIHIKVIHNPET